MEKLGTDVNDIRCCMCPNVDDPSNQICPAIAGTPHDKESKCKLYERRENQMKTNESKSKIAYRKAWKNMCSRAYKQGNIDLAKRAYYNYCSFGGTMTYSKVTNLK